MSRREQVILVIVVFMLGMFAGVMTASLVYLGNAEAEEMEMTYKCWAVCQPGSEIMIRQKPNRRAEVVGAVTVGELMRTDWKEKDGWLHLVDVSNETGEGWIHEGYVVFEEPKEINREMTICSRGRVACRKWIGGERKRWVNNGDSVTVYLMTSEVAVTNWGFIMADYIGE